MPAHVHVHGMLTVEGTKMSKTRGTFINARDYLDAGLAPEWLRFYFAANLGPSASDIDLSLSEMKNRVNGELLNNVGNLANRAQSILWKSLSGNLGLLPSDSEAVALWNQASLSRAHAMEAYLRYDSRSAVQTALALSAAANERLQRKQPWKMLATDPELAVDVSCWFWTRHGLNASADADDIRTLTKVINGGYNGLADRQARLGRAKCFLIVPA